MSIPPRGPACPVRPRSSRAIGTPVTAQDRGEWIVPAWLYLIGHTKRLIPANTGEIFVYKSFTSAVTRKNGD